MFDIQETTNNCSCSFTTKLEDKTVIGIGSDVTLTCCLNKEYGVRWCKDGCEIFLNDRFQFKDERFKHQVIIAGIQEADSGVYSCQCGRTKTSCKLKVKVNLLIKQLEDVTITTDQKLILTCKLNAKCNDVKWCKTNGTISYRATTTVHRIGGSNVHKYRLELNPVKMEDAGEYSCHIENVITTCNVMVKEIKELNSDTSVETPTLVHELISPKQQLEVTEDELNKRAKDVDQKESIIEQNEKEIEKLRALLKEKEDTIKSKERELENKAHCIKKLKEENKKLAESDKKLKSINKELKSNKQLMAQMKEQIQKLEAEKKHMEGRVSILESSNSNKKQQKPNKQLQKDNEQRTKLSGETEEKEKSKACSVS